ncbi:hypothetical protein M413DRAFT_443930 [Hebeloma cylindrosporum]|uniref:Fungal-type protein kinase domain-containing protein n=1 Tax=Hebeloma cylindrosporum TaxID=76867 RepID=A0A0C3C2J6_HEBCY|nr:hypothetical protein M413DRAFT_443930 [Hebeloma cylindrosporum h7]
MGNPPRLVAHRELNDASMAILAKLVGFAEGADEAQGSRTLCILAFDILEPITSLQGKALWKAYWEIIECHYILWKAGIQHGDISVPNLMHRNGTGVLNDFDLARLAIPGDSYHRGFDHTGATPFLALDLLAADAQGGRVERRYRHELESFFWILAWIIACYDNGVELKSISAAHRLWLHEDLEICSGAKTTMLSMPEVILGSMRNSHNGLYPVIPILNKYWTDFHSARIQEKFHSVTQRSLELYGHPPSFSLTHTVPMELSDEEILSNMLRAFVSHPAAEFLKSEGFMAHIPFKLFPTFASFLAPST